MPFFKYLGIPQEQQDRMLETVMAPLESDFEPHPTWGGFPTFDRQGNPAPYYAGNKDGVKRLREKEENRRQYREAKRTEFLEGLEKQNAVMSFWAGNQRAGGVKYEFPNGELVEVPGKDKPHLKLIGKLRTLEYFEEGQDSPAKPVDPPKGVPQDPPKNVEIPKGERPEMVGDKPKRGPGRPKSK